MSEKAKGIHFIIQIFKDADWITVAGQRGGKLNRSADTLDVTSKDSEGWKEHEYSFREWSIDADGLIVENDEGYKALDKAYFDLEKVKVKMVTQAGNKYEGLALLTDFPTDAPYNDSATYSVKLQGAGKLEFAEKEVTGV